MPCGICWLYHKLLNQIEVHLAPRVCMIDWAELWGLFQTQLVHSTGYATLTKVLFSIYRNT